MIHLFDWFFVDLTARNNRFKSNYYTLESIPLQDDIGNNCWTNWIELNACIIISNIDCREMEKMT